jgi:predicted ester cyclase
MTTSDVLPSDPVSAESARSFADNLLAAWNSHDPERLVALSDPAVRWEDPFIPGGRLDGHDALRDWLAGTWRAMPDLDGPLHLAQDGRSVMVAWRGVATMTGPLNPPGFAPTGQRVEMSGVDTHWIRNGRLGRVRTVTDVMAVARQIGAAPEPGTMAERAGVLVQRLAARRLRHDRKGRGPA